MAEVFLIEDSAPLRRILTAQLREAGYNVTGFDNGLVSADTDMVRGADVLITDIAMPGVDGIEVINNVRSSFPDLPVIAITGEPRQRLDDLDVFGRLRKPFSEQDLTDLVRRAMERGEPSSG
jgi:CheY-like chemotaxis protein